MKPHVTSAQTRQPRRRAASIKLALRISSRDMRRHPWRSLLVILVIALPAFGMSAALTYMAYTKPTDADIRIEQLMGFDARIVASGGPHDEHQSPTTYGPLEEAVDLASAEKMADFPLPKTGV